MARWRLSGSARGASLLAFALLLAACDSKRVDPERPAPEATVGIPETTTRAGAPRPHGVAVPADRPKQGIVISFGCGRAAHPPATHAWGWVARYDLDAATVSREHRARR